MIDQRQGSHNSLPAISPKSSARGPASNAMMHPGGNSMAPSDYVIALCVLMGSLFIPFTALYLLLRLKRGAAKKPAPVKVRP